MTVRAKFKVQRTETTMGTVPVYSERGAIVEYRKAEIRSIILQPVYDSNPDSENGRFYAATPSGEIRLNTLNPEASQAFELDGEYYVDFTPAS